MLEENKTFTVPETGVKGSSPTGPFPAWRPEKYTPASVTITGAWVQHREHVMVSEQEVLKSFLGGMVTAEVLLLQRGAW